MIEPEDVVDEATADALPLLRDLERLRERLCAACRRGMCGHEILFSIAMGFKDVPRCLGCLSRALDQPRAELRDRLYHLLRRRDCYQQAWRVAGEREGSDPAGLPTCLWPAGSAPTAPAELPGARTTGPRESPAAEAFWDAGEMACGDLVLALRGKLNALSPGVVLRVIARDPAAPEDLPAWCRLTGHRLVRGDHPEYHIQRKGA
jgi:tRNA 2-thiouridine synthesizing protein A